VRGVSPTRRYSSLPSHPIHVTEKLNMTFAPDATIGGTPSMAGDRPGPVGDSAAPAPTPCTACALRKACLVGRLPQSIHELGPLIREGRFRQGETLSREGDFSAHVRVVKAGMVLLCRRSSQGVSRPVAVARPSAVFGICSYLTQPNQVSVLAATSGRYCEIETARVLGLAKDDKAFRQQVGHCLVNAVSTLAQWAEAIGNRNVVTQVANVLRLLAASQGGTSVTLPSLTALGEMLGTTRESVARALTSLEACGCLLKSSLRRYDIHLPSLTSWLAGHPLSDSSLGLQTAPVAPRARCNN